MAVNYTWKIASLDVIPSIEIDGTTHEDVVKRVHWRLKGTDDADGTSTEVYGVENLAYTDVSSDTFVQLSELTTATLASWAKTLMEQQEPGRVDQLKQAVANRIAEQQDPPEISKLPASTTVPDSEV